MIRYKRHREFELPTIGRPGFRIGVRNFLMLIAALSVLIGYALFELTGTSAVFYASCGVMAASCGYHALSNLFRMEINIGAVFCSQTILWYVLPFSYIGFFDYYKYISMYSELENANSAFIVTIVSYSAYLLFERYGSIISIRNKGIGWREFLPIVLPILLSQVYLIAGGSRGYANVVGAYGEREQSLLYQFIGGFSVGIMPICAISLAIILRGRENRKAILPVLFWIGALIIQVLWWSTAGRRSMTMVSIISMVSFFSIYFNGRMNISRKIAIAAISIISLPVLLFFWESYYLLRVATDASGGQENLSFLDLGRARNLVSDGDVSSQFAENIVRRPFSTVTSLTLVRNTASGILWGWNGASQALLAIPSIFFPGKFEFIGPVLEVLWHNRLGVPMNDWANTIFLEGYIDFGFYGIFIYSLTFSIIFSFIFRFSDRIGYNSIVIFTYFSICFFIMNTETTANTLFVAFRSTLSVVLIALFVKILQAKRSAGA